MTEFNKRFILIRNVAAASIHTYSVSVDSSIEDVLTRWRNDNNCRSADMCDVGFYTTDGISLDSYKCVGDLPLLRRDLNYVDIFCVTAQPTTFTVFGYPEYRVEILITKTTSMEDVRRKICKTIPDLGHRRFEVWSTKGKLFSDTKLFFEQSYDTADACFINLVYDVELVDLSRETRKLTLRGNEESKIELYSLAESPKEGFFVVDDDDKVHMIDRSKAIASAFKPYKGLSKDKFRVRWMKKQSVLIYDPPDAEDDFKLKHLEMWPTDNMLRVLCVLRKKRKRGVKRSVVLFDGRILTPDTTLLELTDAIPILHLHSQIEIYFCDHTTEIHSTVLASSANLSKLRDRIMKRYNCNSPIQLRYNGFLLDSDEMLLYEFNIRNRSMIHVQHYRQCVINYNNKTFSMGHFYELYYSYIFRKAQRILCPLDDRPLDDGPLDDDSLDDRPLDNGPLSIDTVFVCKCGRRLTNEEESSKLSVDCCRRRRHEQMELTVHSDVTVRFLLSRLRVVTVRVRTDKTVAHAIPKFWEKLPKLCSLKGYSIPEKSDVRFMNERGMAEIDLSTSLYTLRKESLDYVDVQLEIKMTIYIQMGQRQIKWKVWPSESISLAFDDVNEYTTEFFDSSAKRWWHKGRKIHPIPVASRFTNFRACGVEEDAVIDTELRKSKSPRDRDKIGNEGDVDVGCQAFESLTRSSIVEGAACQVFESDSEPDTPASSSQYYVPATPVPKIPPNISLDIENKVLKYHISEDDSAASLCTRLQREAKIITSSSVILPDGRKIFPYDSEWRQTPIPGTTPPSLEKKIILGTSSAIRFIVIAIAPLSNPMSFFVKSDTPKQLTEVISELHQRKLVTDDNDCWFTQVGRYFTFEKKECHGVATVLGSMQTTFFISNDGELFNSAQRDPKSESGSVTITNVVRVNKEMLTTIPPFGDPKVEVYLKSVFLMAGEHLGLPPTEVKGAEKAFTRDVFVYIRGVRVLDGGSKALCPSSYSGRFMNADTGKLIKPQECLKSAENFILLFNNTGVLPKFKIALSDDVRLFFRADAEVFFKDGRFSMQPRPNAGADCFYRWIADIRTSDLTRGVGEYLKRKK